MATLNDFGPKLKITRAKRHVRDLESLIESFVSDNPHRVEIYETPDQPGISVRGVFDRPLPNETATIVGDAIHNVRAGLDHLAAEAVRAGGKSPDRNTGFPIYLDEAGFNGGITSKLAGAPPEFVDFVKGLAPYKTASNGAAGNIGLWIAAQLDNLDKHMVLLPSIGVIRLPSLEIKRPDGTTMATIDGAQIGGNGHINAFRFGGEGLTYETKGEPAFGIRFANTGIVDGEDVPGLLKALVAVAEGIIANAAKLELS